MEYVALATGLGLAIGSGAEGEERIVKLDAQVGRRLELLVQKGQAVLDTHRPTPGMIGFATLSWERYAEWRSQSLACLGQVFGATHIYTENFASHTERTGYVSSAEAGLGVLRAASEDVEHGYLETIQHLATAEVFSNFIDQADHLLQSDYHVPAASLAAAVLENGLRSLAERNDITVTARDDLPSLNTKLADKGTYSRLRQKQVAVWTDVRNDADHGRFEEVTKDNATELIRGVRAFLAEYL